VKLDKIKKGQKIGVPTHIIDPDKEGWTTSESPEDGLLVTLDNALERQAGAVLINKRQLRKAGYKPIRPIRRKLSFFRKLTKAQLAAMIVAYGETPSGTKENHIKQLLGLFY